MKEEIKDWEGRLGSTTTLKGKGYSGKESVEDTADTSAKAEELASNMFGLLGITTEGGAK